MAENIAMEIVAKIREHIELYDDYEAFLKVCSSWRLAIKKFPTRYINKKHTQHPLLMLADDDNSSYTRYYSYSKGKFLKIDPPLSLSPPQTRRYYTSRGWLILVTRNISESSSIDNVFNISIFNPFSNNNVVIEAPLFHIGEDDIGEWEDEMYLYIFGKFAISTCPSNAKVDSDYDFVVSVIFGEDKKLAYWRPGHDDTWVVPYKYVYHLEDLCFFRGELYAIQWNSAVISFGDLKDHKNSRELRVVTKFRINCSENILYLVEPKYDQGDTSTLLVIQKSVSVGICVGNKYKVLSSFNVLKLNVDNGNLEKVKSLGNQAIFVGFNSTFSVNVDDNDRGCIADCIYYTDDSNSRYLLSRGVGDMGIYSLRQGNTLLLHRGPSQLNVINPPTWIEFSST